MLLLGLTLAAACTLFFTERRNNALDALRPLAKRWSISERLHWVPLLVLVAAGVPGFLFRFDGRVSSLDLAIAAGFAWTALSWLWAENKMLTATRLANWLLVGVGAFMVAKQLGFDSSVVLVACCALLFQLVGLLEELATRSFAPSNPDYRFAGTVNATKQAEYGVLSTFSLTYLYLAGVLHVSLFAPLVVAASALFLLTRTLNSLWSAALAVVVPAALVAFDTWQVLLVLGIGLIAVAAASVHAGARLLVLRMLMLGRYQPDWGRLSGRVPLWRFAARGVAQRPLLGFGFGGFWEPSRSLAAAEEIGRRKPVISCVCFYLDVLLTTGIVGLVVIGAIAWQAVESTVSAAYPQREYLLAVLIYVALHNVFESGFFQANVRSFALLVILFALQ